MHPQDGHSVKVSDHNRLRQAQSRGVFGEKLRKSPVPAIAFILACVVLGLSVLLSPASPEQGMLESFGTIMPAGLTFLAAAWVALSALWPS